MTGRWITVGLLALALASCGKKEEKPPPPKTETPPTTTATPAAPPVATTQTPAAPPPAVTTDDAPPTITSTYTANPPPAVNEPKTPPADQRPTVKIIKAKQLTAKVVKTKAQVAAEQQVVGTWIEQKRRQSVLRFTADGKVTEKSNTTTTWSGEWVADSNGAIQFDLAMKGAKSALDVTAYPTPAKIMAVVPHWGKNLPGSGQFAYERMH